MIAGLDSAYAPTAAQLAQAKARGVRIWSGYLATKPDVNLLNPWTKKEFDRVKAAGLSCIAFCSGYDDPVACKNLAAEWGVRLCLDVEDRIRKNGPWVQPWLTKSGSGLYGNAPVFRGRTAAFYILAWYPGQDPGRTWVNDPRYPRPNGPCGWQWWGTHTEFGRHVDRGWYVDWFAPAQGGENHWASLGGSWHQDPAVARNLDGRLELLATGDDRHLYDLAQTAPNGGWWSKWADLGAPPAGGAAGRPAVGRNLDGRLAVFVRGEDGTVYHRWQQSPGGALTPTWAALGGGSWHQDPVVAQNLDGRMELFVIGDDARLYDLGQSAPNGSWWSSWADLGAAPPGGAAGSPAVGRNLDGRLEVFLRGDDGKVYHRWQQGPGAPLTPTWARLGGGSWDRDPVVAQNLDGRLELVVISRDGHLYVLAQGAPNGSWWSSWADLGAPPPGGAAGSPAVGRNLDGRLEVFLRGGRKLYHRWQQTPGGAFTPNWVSMGGSFGGSPVVARNQNGRLELFVVGAGARLYHDWQLAPNDGWA